MQQQSIIYLMENIEMLNKLSKRLKGIYKGTPKYGIRKVVKIWQTSIVLK